MPIASVRLYRVYGDLIDAGRDIEGPPLPLVNLKSIVDGH